MWRLISITSVSEIGEDSEITIYGGIHHTKYQQILIATCLFYKFLYTPPPQIC